MGKKYKEGAYCGDELGDVVYRTSDTFLIKNYMENDEDNNAFCCDSCASAFFGVEEYENKD